MIIDIFLIVIILVCFFFLANIAASKFSILSKIKVERINKEREKKTKFAILQKRFIDNIKNSSVRNKVIDFFSLKLINLKSRFNNLESKYKERFNQIIKESPVDTEGKIEQLLKDGDYFFSENKLEDAEKKFSEVVSFDPRNLAALKNLFKIYFFGNKLSEAKKIGEYILQLNKQALKWWLKFNKSKNVLPDNLTNELFSSLVNLGDLNFKMGKTSEATKNYKNALSYNPNNPRVLDFLIENSIILRKKEETTSYLNRIKEINPENQKISEWEEKIKNLP